MTGSTAGRGSMAGRATELLWYAFAVSFALPVFAWGRIEIGVFLAPWSLFILLGIAYLALLRGFAAGAAPGAVRGLSPPGVKGAGGYLAALFLLALTAAVANLFNTVEHLEILIQFWISIGAALIIPVFLRDERIQKNVLYILVLSITALGAYGAAGVLLDEERWLEVGTVGSRNVNAFLFQLAAVAALGLFVFEKKGIAVRSMLLAAFFANTVFVYLTLSRGGLVGIACALLFFGRRKKLAVAAAAAVIAAAAVFAMPEKYLARALSTFNFEDRYIEYEGGEFGNTIPGRLSIQKFYSEILVKQPVFGHGFGYIRDRIRTNTNLYPYRTHSSYLGIAVEAGLAGAFVFVSVFAVLFVKMRRIKRAAATAGGAVPMLEIASVLLIAAALNCVYMDLYSWIYFWQLIGLIAAVVAAAECGMGISAPAPAPAGPVRMAEPI